MPLTRGRRPVATSSLSPRSSRPSSNSRTKSSPSRRAAFTLADRASSMPSRRRTSPSASPSGAGSRAEHVLGHVDDHHLTAQPAHCLGHLDADRPAAEDRAAAAGRPSCEVTSRLPQTPSSSRRPGTGGTNGSAPFASTTWSAVWRTPSTSTTPGPASRPLPRSRSMPFSASQRSCAGVRVVRDHEVAPGERRLDVDLRARRRLARRRAPPRPAAAASWTGCTPSRSTRRRPARARRSRRAGRPRPARRRSARPASPRRARSRRSRCSWQPLSSPPCTA